jgi:hypothetical protein
MDRVSAGKPPDGDAVPTGMERPIMNVIAGIVEHGPEDYPPPRPMLRLLTAKVANSWN